MKQRVSHPFFFTLLIILTCLPFDFLSFPGNWWFTGEPGFSDELVIGWTKHIISNSGAVTWDLPLSDEGIQGLL